MPPQSKSRKKRSVDVVSFEDLLAAHKTERGPGQLPLEGVVLIGVDLELQRRMAEGFAAPNRLESQPSLDAPKFSAPTFNLDGDCGINNGAPNNSALGNEQRTLPRREPNTDTSSQQFGHAREDSPRTNIDPEPPFPSKFSAPNFDEEFCLEDLLIRKTRSKSYVIHSIARIEDVFTSAERDLLKWMWERGRSVPNTQIRLLTGTNGEGARRLATQAGLIYNTFKNLTRSLATKLAIDIVKPERNLPTLYVVYHYSLILGRQRAAGFTGAVHKNGGGRELVNAKAQAAPRRSDLAVKDLEHIIGAPKFSAPQIGSGAPNFTPLSTNSGAPKIASPIRNKEYTSVKEDTTSPTSYSNLGAPKIVGDALFHRTGRTDIDAARLITKGCLESNATIQPHEIARLIESAHIPPNITNPVGFLIRALPSQCAAESIAHYRDQWRREDEQEKRRAEQEKAQTIVTARSILESVANGEQWDNDTLEWAKNILASQASII